METSLPDAEIRRDPLWGTIRHAAAEPLSRSLDREPGFRDLRERGDPAEIALFFLEAHRALFRLKDPRRELAVLSVTTDGLGLSHVRMGQVYEGLEVWGAEIAVHLGAQCEVTVVNGRYVPTPEGLVLEAGLGPGDALARAAEALGAPLRDGDGADPQLVILPLESGQLALAFLVRARVSDAQAWTVLIDANDGSALERIPGVFRPRAGANPTLSGPPGAEVDQ